MKILITGSNGVIGKFLKNKIKDHTIVPLNRSIADLSDRESVKNYFENNNDFDVILHCAIQGGRRFIKDDWKIMDDNIRMYYNIIEFINTKTKLISFGSGAENHLVNTPYGLSKKVISKSLLYRENSYNIRLYGVFGEGEEEARFIKSNLMRYANKESMKVYESKYMDFFYIEDLLSVVNYYIENKDLPKEVDCCYDGVKTSLYSIAQMINKLDNYQVEIQKEYSLTFNSPLYYTGNSTILNNLPIDLIGFEKALQLEYEKYKLHN